MGKIGVPSAQKKRKDPGVPKFAAKAARKAETKAKAMEDKKAKWAEQRPGPSAAKRARTTFASMATTSTSADHTYASDHPAEPTFELPPLDPSIMLKDSSAKAFMSHLRKVIDQSDVIIQVLDARDPLGGRSRYVEDEVRRREGEGKKLIAVVNKIDLVPRSAVEQWLRYLRHDFPTLPFKSSTQSQRTHISSMHLPVSSSGATHSAHAADAALTTPVTSLALGAAPLIQLLKSYARHLPPGRSLTVGIVGFPNVGKSSLINSLKRSRACPVASTPGHTRVVQEVSLDKGVKILDCPGIVFDPAMGTAEERLSEEEVRRRRGEVILRNCVKPELVEDVLSPMEIIINRVDHAQLERLYSVPPFENVNQFLVSIALVRGRLGKGGVPDLESSAVQVLRDWNTGKISYHTVPPAVHPSSVAKPLNSHAPEYAQEAFTSGAQAGESAIVKGFAPAFDISALMGAADEEAFGEREPPAMEMLEDESALLDGKGDEMDLGEPLDSEWGGMEDYVGLGVLKGDSAPTAPLGSVQEEREEMDDDQVDAESSSYPASTSIYASLVPRTKNAQTSRLFTRDETVAMSMNNPLARKNQKAERKKKDKEMRRLQEAAGLGRDSFAGGGNDDDMDL